MKSVFTAAAAALLLAGNSVAQLMVNTPLSAVVCQPLLISWTAGTPPYFLSILPGNQPTAPALLSFPPQTGLSITWTVNITVGTTLGLDLRDNTGTLVQSGPFTIQSGADLSCLTASSSTSSGTGSTTPPNTSSTPTPTTPVTTPPVTTPTTPPATTSKPSTSSSGTPSKSSTTPAPSSAAAGQNLNLGFAGVLGAVLVALLA